MDLFIHFFLIFFTQTYGGWELFLLLNLKTFNEQYITSWKKCVKDYLKKQKIQTKQLPL
jgi:hypothetical protein